MPEPSTPLDGVVAVTMPQINVNDEQVVLVSWRIADGECVTPGAPLYPTFPIYPCPATLRGGAPL